MTQTHALIFGYNDYTKEIEKNIASEFKSVNIFRLDDESENSFDLSDDWDDIRHRFNISECVAFCILEDMAENVFLTISLRDTFKELHIVALAQDKESMDKLELAGATRVLASMQTTANVIVDILEKPIVTDILHNILYEKSDLKIAEITIKDHSVFDGKYPTDIEWSRDHGIVIIFVVHEDGSRDFIYSSKAKHNLIKSGDIFIVVGFKEDIKSFERLIGANDEQ